MTVPTCTACEEEMDLVRECRRVTIYECCIGEKVVTADGWEYDPRRR